LKLNSIARMWWAFLCVFVDCWGVGFVVCV
jgi:hypothetical protein